MKRYQPLLFILAIGVLAMLACGKDRGDLYGDKLLRGRLFLVDTIAGDGVARSLAAKTIYLSYQRQDGLQFLYTAITDTGGYFLFRNLNKDSLYLLRYSDTISGTYVTAIEDSLRLSADRLDLRLIASPNLQTQNALQVICRDAKGDPLPNTTVCIFNNLGFANANPCAGSILSIKTNAQGQALRYNVPAGILHFNAQSDTSALPRLTGSLRNEAVPPAGLKRITLVLN